VKPKEKLAMLVRRRLDYLFSSRGSEAFLAVFQRAHISDEARARILAMQREYGDVFSNLGRSFGLSTLLGDGFSLVAFTDDVRRFATVARAWAELDVKSVVLKHERILSVPRSSRLLQGIPPPCWELVPRMCRSSSFWSGLIDMSLAHLRWRTLSGRWLAPRRGERVGLSLRRQRDSLTSPQLTRTQRQWPEHDNRSPLTVAGQPRDCFTAHRIPLSLHG
jgi:hypothetical protein